MAHAFKFGIEEELFLANARSRAAPSRSTDAFHEDARRRLNGVEREVLQSQVEIMTEPSASFEETRRHYAGLRTGLAEIGRRHGLKVFAAGTHPTAIWLEQKGTDKARYRDIIEELQIVGRRWVVCGQHVHVEVPRPAARIDLMNRLLPFLPLLLALSTSSPFWGGRRTGLAGYRLRAYEELPRSGLPELFDDAADYDRFVRAITRSGAVRDPTFLWWHIRPSVRYPTLELRIADSCTRLDDAVAVAAQDGYQPVAAAPAGLPHEPAVPGGERLALQRVQLLDALHCSQERSRMAGLAQRRGGAALGWEALQPPPG